MATEHTKGPWIRSKAGGTIISEHTNGLGEQGKECTEYYGGNVIAETVAECNMPLIMAAPDMLDAMKMASEIIKDSWNGDPMCEPDCQAWHILQAAIAKAEGAL